MTDLRSSRRWRTVAARICVAGSTCHRCGEPIQFGLRAWHPRGPSVDHRIPLALGGDPYDPDNLVPMHYGCNSSKGARIEVETWSEW